MFSARYEETCRDPRRFLDRLCAFLEARGIPFRRRTQTPVPEAFTPTIVNREENEDTREIARHLDKLTETYGETGRDVHAAL